MNTDDLIKFIQSEIQKQIKENKNFRTWHRMDSATDVFSPITGNSQQIGFFGTSKVSKPTVTGSRGSNAALTSLLTSLANLGLIVNNSS